MTKESEHFTFANEAEIEDIHILCLPDTVQPSNALFDAHRVPGKVVVDDGVGKLQVTALPSRL